MDLSRTDSLPGGCRAGETEMIEMLVMPIPRKESVFYLLFYLALENNTSLSCVNPSR